MIFKVDATEISVILLYNSTKEYWPPEANQESSNPAFELIAYKSFALKVPGRLYVGSCNDWEEENKSVSNSNVWQGIV